MRTARAGRGGTVDAGVKEYLRRNLYHASAVGAHASLEKAMEILIDRKRPPSAVLMHLLSEAEVRLRALPKALAEWRDIIKPHPFGVTTSLGGRKRWARIQKERGRDRSDRR